MKNQKGFIQIILVIFIIVLVGGAAYYFGTIKGKSSLIMATSTPLPTPIIDPGLAPEPVPNGTLDPTANWKTYTNSKYSFSFRYPATLSSNVGVVSGPSVGTSEALETFSDPTTIREGTDAPFDGFSVYKVTNPYRTFKEYIDAEFLATQESPYGDGKNVTLQNYYSGSLIALSNNISYYFRPSADEKTIIVFSISKTSKDSEFIPVADKILLTFWFTK